MNTLLLSQIQDKDVLLGDHTTIHPQENFLEKDVMSDCYPESPFADWDLTDCTDSGGEIIWNHSYVEDNPSY